VTEQVTERTEKRPTCHTVTLKVIKNGPLLMGSVPHFRILRLSSSLELAHYVALVFTRVEVLSTAAPGVQSSPGKARLCARTSFEQRYCRVHDQHVSAAMFMQVPGRVDLSNQLVLTAPLISLHLKPSQKACIWTVDCVWGPSELSLVPCSAGATKSIFGLCSLVQKASGSRMAGTGEVPSRPHACRRHHQLKPGPCCSVCCRRTCHPVAL
jgi:hypothetical protein